MTGEVLLYLIAWIRGLFCAGMISSEVQKNHILMSLEVHKKSKLVEHFSFNKNTLKTTMGSGPPFSGRWEGEPWAVPQRCWPEVRIATEWRCAKGRILKRRSTSTSSFLRLFVLTSDGVLDVSSLQSGCKVNNQSQSCTHCLNLSQASPNASAYILTVSLSLSYAFWCKHEHKKACVALHNASYTRGKLTGYGPRAPGRAILARLITGHRALSQQLCILKCNRFVINYQQSKNLLQKVLKYTFMGEKISLISCFPVVCL